MLTNHLPYFSQLRYSMLIVTGCFGTHYVLSEKGSMVFFSYFKEGALKSLKRKIFHWLEMLNVSSCKRTEEQKMLSLSTSALLYGTVVMVACGGQASLLAQQDKASSPHNQIPLISRPSFKSVLQKLEPRLLLDSWILMKLGESGRRLQDVNYSSVCSLIHTDIHGLICCDLYLRLCLTSSRTSYSKPEWLRSLNMWLHWCLDRFHFFFVLKLLKNGRVGHWKFKHDFVLLYYSFYKSKGMHQLCTSLFSKCKEEARSKKANYLVLSVLKPNFLL